MSSNRNTNASLNLIAGILGKISPRFLIPLVLFLAGGVLFFTVGGKPAKKSTAPANMPSVGHDEPGSYLFCSWNVENLFDDVDDPKNDDSMEDWFAHNPDKFRLKVERLADVLLQMNDGKGPDVMALNEVESTRCLEALRDTLNERLAKGGLAESRYESILFLGDKLGRRFAPGILTRLPVIHDRTRKVSTYAGNGRTIEGHLVVNQRKLIILAAHWTSRVDHDAKSNDNADRRMSYAKDFYGRYKAIVTANPDADVILCGDFNDEFRDASIRDGLHATDSPEDTRRNDTEPLPYALFAHWKSPNDPPGSIYGKGHWSVFDHIMVSRGLFDDHGWTCDPNSSTIFASEGMRSANSTHAPFRFGDERETKRGYSDHFPVTVRLSVK